MQARKLGPIDASSFGLPLPCNHFFTPIAYVFQNSNVKNEKNLTVKKTMHKIFETLKLCQYCTCGYFHLPVPGKAS